MRYTASADGKERTTLRIPYRVTKDERRELVKMAKRRGMSLYTYLSTALDNGLQYDYTEEADEHFTTSTEED